MLKSEYLKCLHTAPTFPKRIYNPHSSKTLIPVFAKLKSFDEMNFFPSDFLHDGPEAGNIANGKHF